MHTYQYRSAHTCKYAYFDCLTLATDSAGCGSMKYSNQPFDVVAHILKV